MVLRGRNCSLSYQYFNSGNGKGTTQACDHRQNFIVCRQLLKGKWEKVRNLFPIFMPWVLGLSSCTTTFPLWWVMGARKKTTFSFCLRVHICGSEIILHFHSSCWWVSADLYYHVIMGSRDCVSLNVMACDCLLHYFQWDSVLAIRRDSIPLKVIVWDCPHCSRALNWIEFILIGMGRHDAELTKFSGQQLIKFSCRSEECILTI